MLGEDHSLLKEFPEHTDKIKALNASDENFARDCDDYNSIDTEIRNLELGNAPIGDTEMHALKRKRSALKDSLYTRLISNQG